MNSAWYLLAIVVVMGLCYLNGYLQGIDAERRKQYVKR